MARAVDEATTRAFGALGRAVARRPRVTVLACVLVFLACGAGVMKLDQETRAERLFTPQDSVAFDAEEYVYATYGVPERVNEVYIVSAGWEAPGTSAGGSMLARSKLLEMMDWYEDVVLATEATYKDETYTWEHAEVCYRPGGAGTPCDIASVLDVWSYDRAALEADDDVLGTLSAAEAAGATDALGRPLSFNSLIAGIVRGEDGNILSAEALKVLLKTQNNEVEIDNDYLDPVTDAWERATSAATRDWSAARGEWDGAERALRAEPLFQGAEDGIQGDAILGDVTVLGAGCMCLMLYAASVLGSNRAVESSAWLTAPSVLAILMAIACSLGLGSLMGLQFNAAVQVAFFILLGIGIDDTFVIVEHLYGPEHLHDQEAGLSVEERIGSALAKAGSSIVVTSATDVIAFVAGMFTSLPALRAFCGYTALGILFDFAFQVTFFVAFLTWDLRRRDAKRRDCVCCRPAALGNTCCGGPAKDSSEPSKSLSYKLAAEWLPSISMSSAGRYVVLAIAAGLLALGGVGIDRVESDFNIDWFTPRGSWLQDVYELRDAYFRGRLVPFGIYTQDAPNDDYYAALDQVSALTDAMDAHEEISRKPPLDSWYASLEAWRTTPAGIVAVADTSAAVDAGDLTEHDAWAATLKAFLASDAGSAYTPDVTFDGSGDAEHISHTRMFAFVTHQGSGMEQVDAMKSIRASAEEAAPDLDVVVYTKAFVFWEGLAVIKGETVRNVIVAACLVFVVCLLLLADVVMALVLLAMVGMVDVELLGFMYIMDLSYNSVSFVFLVVSIGIAVDYSVHIARAFMGLRGTRLARARGALREIGGAVLDGAISTMIPVAILGLAESYVFRVFHRMLVSIIVLGAFNGLVVLPVVLSFAGSMPYDSATKCVDEDGKIIPGQTGEGATKGVGNGATGDEEAGTTAAPNVVVATKA